MVRPNLVAICLFAGTKLLFAGEILQFGNFSRPLSEFWYGGNFGGGTGSVEVMQEMHDGRRDSFVRLEKRKGPGGVQLISRFIPLRKSCRYRFSMRYRMNGGLAFLRYEKRTASGECVPIEGAIGGPIVVTFDRLLKEPGAVGGKWRSFDYETDVPSVVQRVPDAGLVIQFQTYPKADSTGYFEIDDIDVEYLVKLTPSDREKVSLSVKNSTQETGREAVEKVFDLDWKIDSGLFYRNGRPYFFCGWGNDTGGGQEGAQGLWLARLQGIRFIGTFEPGDVRLRERKPGSYEAYVGSHPGWLAWQREAARFGMLTTPHACTGYRASSEMGRFCLAHPEWSGLYFDLGHYLAWDTVDPVGRAIVAERRKHYFGYTFPLTGTDYCELAREPGVENVNERMLRDFREFVKAKYKKDLGLVNRIWRTSFGSWDEIRVLHLDPDALAASPHALALRSHVRTKYAEHYFDFLRFLQLDTERRCRNEFQDIRQRVPGLPVTVDMRGHQIYTDGYMAYDPETIGPLEDICHVHYGFQARHYNSTPFDEDTLYDQMAYTLFAHGFFVRNTQCPVVQCEDIVATAGLPGSDDRAMVENDLAQLHRRPWKFRLEEPGENGLSEGWYKKEFDDSAWGAIHVPGAWDEQESYRGRGGIGWYRIRFKLDPRFRNDYLDGSRRFLVHGRGVAQRGVLWINGVRVGEAAGWDETYSFDVGGLLSFDGENEMVWRVVGDLYQNGLRRCCHVLCEDMLNAAVAFGERQYAQMYWSYMMRGLSGVLNWNWHRDRLMPYLPDVLAPLETAAGVALEDLRSRRSKVAYLYGFLSHRGLPCLTEKRHYETMRWFGALEFSGIRPDVVGERTFVREVNPLSYPLLVVPESELVDDSTYSHFKRYVREGGTAIITTNALRKTFSRYEKTDIDSLPGKIVRLPENLPLVRLMDALKPYLPEPEVNVESTSDAKELLVVERMLAGGKDAKVLYLNNWGGVDHELQVRIPSRYRGWTMTSLRGAFYRDGESGALRVYVPSQDVAACLLTRQGPEPWMVTRASEPNRQAWERIKKLNAGTDTDKENALWLCDRHLYPYLLDRFDAFGLDNVAVDSPSALTRSELDRARVLVVVEGLSKPYAEVFRDSAFSQMICDWVAAGGSLFVAAHSAGTVNANGSVLRRIANSYGLNGDWCKLACDRRNFGLGDAWQICSNDIAIDEGVARRVKEVQLFAHSPMTLMRMSKAKPIVRIPAAAESGAGKISVATVEFGKGRVFISADSMFMQPMRIELADNAFLLENAVGWLLREEVTDEMRLKFKDGLFLTKEAFQ